MHHPVRASVTCVPVAPPPTGHAALPPCVQDPQQYNSADMARRIDGTIRQVMDLSAQVQVGHGSHRGCCQAVKCLQAVNHIVNALPEDIHYNLAMHLVGMRASPQLCPSNSDGSVLLMMHSQTLVDVLHRMRGWCTSALFGTQACSAVSSARLGVLSQIAIKLAACCCACCRRLYMRSWHWTSPTTASCWPGSGVLGPLGR